ncbi:hypothetical protein [Asticcacaulis sp.]|uniref:hypothetical protein n=1 Tax=Asticcacaulis sp. TaxID=1872648 RepID=UPI002C5B0B32|nr:hypothetical protein [Asticcacaulis sp.]HTM81872.1 hypothetical protein [Asticcacaulis sp.]
MKYVKTYIPAAVLIGGLLALSASAQEATVVPTPTGPTQEADTPPTPGTPEHAAQLQREHKRAVAAGDHANDPLNSASSDALNQQEAAKARALGNAPVPADTVTNAQPVPNPNLPDASGNTTGALPADPAPALIPPPADSLPPPIHDPLQPAPDRVQ